MDYENLGFDISVGEQSYNNAVSRLDNIIKRLERIQKLEGKGNKTTSTSNGRVGGSIKGMTQEEKWDKQYQDRVRKQAYYLKQGYVQQKNIISDHTKWVLAEEKKLEKKRFLTEQGYITPKQEKTQLSEIEKYTQKVNAETNKLNDKKYEEARKTELANKERQKEIDQRLKQELGIKQNTKSLTSYISKLTSVVVLAKKLAHFMSGAIKESADYVENLNLFAVAFGESYKQQLDWALNIADAYGLASNEVLKFAGTFRELSTSLGLVGDTADIVTQTVTNLGYDLSALFNTTVEQAMEKLQSGIFSGNVRPLRAYGIDISQNQINALFETNEALRQLGVNAQSLSQSDKVLARLIITLQSGKDSFGTMAREINNLQSQFRIFQGALANFKLAIGDLINKPLSQAMVYINGFIIGITEVIRAFVPLTKEDNSLPMTNNIREATEEVENLEGKLASFDKFNVLQQGGQESSNLAVTEALNQLLLEQSTIYQNQLGDLTDIGNKATEIAQSIKDWFLVDTGEVDEAGNKIYDLSDNAQLLVDTLKLLGVVAGVSLVGKIGGAIKSILSFSKGIGGLNTALTGTAIFAFITFVKALEDGDYALAAISGTVMVAVLAFELFSLTNNKKLIPSLANSTKALTTTKLSVLGLSAAFAIGGLVTLLSSEASAGEKVKHIFIGVAAAITAAAIAMAAFKMNWVKALSLGATVAAGYFTVTGLQGFANGGYSNANLIMTHENGKREWVGKAAGSSAIVNDTQMSDIMEGAVAKGVYQALRANSAMGSSGPSNETFVIKIGEEAVFRAVRKTANKQGVDFANV